MKKLSTFQIVVTGAFIFFIVVGVLLFAGVGGFGGKDVKIGKVVIWGTYNDRTMNEILNEISYSDSRFDKLRILKKILVLLIKN